MKKQALQIEEILQLAIHYGIGLSIDKIDFPYSEVSGFKVVESEEDGNYIIVDKSNKELFLTDNIRCIQLEKFIF
jgi:hypothetical protein